MTDEYVGQTNINGDMHDVYIRECSNCKERFTPTAESIRLQEKFCTIRCAVEYIISETSGD